MPLRAAVVSLVAQINFRTIIFTDCRKFSSSFKRENLIPGNDLKQADPETDEVYAQMTLQPVSKVGQLLIIQSPYSDSMTSSCTLLFLW